MTHHFKFDEAKILIHTGQPVLFIGEAGTGKTTLAKQVAEELKIPFYALSMTRQTTLSHLLGFISVNGTYIPSQLRKAIGEGGLFLLDELDAADANVILSLNTIENGYVSFPDGIVDCHPDFRLVATANPPNKHADYTGRSKLDAATLDRFDIIEIPRDNTLETSLVDKVTFTHMQILRKLMQDHNSSKQISMRDSQRYQRRKNLNLLEGFIEKLTGDNPLITEQYKKQIEHLPKYEKQSDCATVDDLWTLIKSEAEQA